MSFFFQDLIDKIQAPLEKEKGLDGGKRKAEVSEPVTKRYRYRSPGLCFAEAKQIMKRKDITVHEIKKRVEESKGKRSTAPKQNKKRAV